MKSLHLSKDSSPGSGPLEKPKSSALGRTRSDLQGIEGAALPGEGNLAVEGAGDMEGSEEDSCVALISTIPAVAIRGSCLENPWL